MIGTHLRLPVSAGVFAAISLAFCPESVAQTAPAQQGAPALAAFKRSMESRLDEERVRIRKYAEPVLERYRNARTAEPESSVPVQELRVQAADAAYQTAKLTRELSEIAVKEYEEGTSLQEVSAVAGAVRLAESDIQRTTAELADASAALEKVKKTSSGTVQETWILAQFQDRLKAATLSKRKAEIEREMARSKLMLLREYEQPRRLKELKSEVEKARAEELSKEQTAQLEKTRLMKLQRESENNTAPTRLQPILELLAEAVRLDGEIRGKLASLEPAHNTSAAESQKEIEQLTRSQEAKLNEAGRLLEDLKFAELAREIR